MKPRRVTILRKGLLVIALPLVYQALFIGLLLKRQQDYSDAQFWAMHTKDVLTQTDKVYRLLLTSQSNLRARLVTDNVMFSDLVIAGIPQIDAELKQLESMVHGNPGQQARFDKVAKAAEARLIFERKIVDLLTAGNRDEVQANIRDLRGQPLMTQLSTEIESFRNTEQKLDTERIQGLYRSNTNQNLLLIGGLLVNIGIGALAAVMFSREISSRIAVVTQNTKRIGTGENLPPIVSGSDEIRELDEQFHFLADHLKSARLRERIYQEALERRAQDLGRANQDLEGKNQEIEMFVYSVSHDLRSPLVNLQGFSRELALVRDEFEELLKHDLTAEDRARAQLLVKRDVTESVHYIQTAVTRLSSIIDALLRLSRAGRVEYHPKLINLEPVIMRIVEAMRGTITERKAEVTVQPLPTVWADPTAAEQIFANLIGNAVNYLDPNRPGRIEIGTEDRTVDGIEKAVTFYVKDNGLGIAEAYLPKVFAIFQRLHGSVAKGEGVGLALVRRVIERHGGKVWVESAESVGSTFYVAFPAEPQLSPLAAVAPKKERITVTRTTTQ